LEGYKYHFIAMFRYAAVNDTLGWFTTESQEKFVQLETDLVDGNRTTAAALKKVWYRQLLTNARSKSFLHVDRITPESFMKYIEQECKEDGSHLLRPTWSFPAVI
jgi:hypothetical protein